MCVSSLFISHDPNKGGVLFSIHCLSFLTKSLKPNWIVLPLIDFFCFLSLVGKSCMAVVLCKAPEGLSLSTLCFNCIAVTYTLRVQTLIFKVPKSWPIGGRGPLCWSLGVEVLQAKFFIKWCFFCVDNSSSNVLMPRQLSTYFSPKWIAAAKELGLSSFWLIDCLCNLSLQQCSQMHIMKSEFGRLCEQPFWWLQIPSDEGH